jgi:hypothetical protein
LIIVVVLIVRNRSKRPAPEPALPVSPVESVLPPSAPVPARPASIRPQSGTSATKPTPARPPVARPAVQPASLERARQLDSQGNLLHARTAYLDLLRTGLGESLRAEIERRLGEINITLLFSPHDMPEKVPYTVQRNDAMDKIARKFGTTTELIVKSNNVRNENRIKAGDMFRVFNGKFSLRISKARCDMILYMNGEFCKRYRVGVGAYDRTPKGEFTVVSKEKNPTWWKRGQAPIPFGDKRNILGTRWMAIKDIVDPDQDERGLGIHGTSDDSSIGKRLSAGCIRLVNADVEELFALLPVGTSVEIAE